MSYHWVPGEEVTADKLNKTSGGLDSATIAYDAEDRVSVVTDNLTGIVYTLTYDSEGRVSVITDGSYTYTITYNSDDNIISVVKT
jgi:YD repeat-containing protein